LQIINLRQSLLAINHLLRRVMMKRSRVVIFRLKERNRRFRDTLVERRLTVD